MPTKRLYCPKCGYEMDGYVAVPGAQHRLCPRCKLEHLLEDDGRGRRVARMTDFRRCRQCGEWFMSGEYSNEPCEKCIAMAKLTNIRERASDVFRDKLLGSSGGTLPMLSGTGSQVESDERMFASTQDRIRANAQTGYWEISVAGGAWVRIGDPPAAMPTGQAGKNVAKVNEVRAKCRNCGTTSVIWTLKDGYQNQLCPMCGERLRNPQPDEPTEATKERPRRRFRLGNDEKE